LRTVDESLGVQKFHDHWVPRLGGVPIFIALFSSLLLAAWVSHSDVQTYSYLIICTLPAFGIGLLEDVTRRAGVLPRLLLTMVAAGLGWWLLKAGLHRLGIPLVDDLLAMYPLLALGLTLVAAGGVAHAVNIIDGYNGLSGFFLLRAWHC
jgi:UDP-GlcNAc:undecaprenyl-phosphate/decaprenyl-phosphate GlcNAc-1-phosphate transferase